MLSSHYLLFHTFLAGWLVNCSSPSPQKLVAGDWKSCGVSFNNSYDISHCRHFCTVKTSVWLRGYMWFRLYTYAHMRAAKCRIHLVWIPTAEKWVVLLGIGSPAWKKRTVRWLAELFHLIDRYTRPLYSLVFPGKSNPRGLGNHLGSVPRLLSRSEFQL